MREHDISPPLVTQEFDSVLNTHFQRAAAVYSKQLFGLKSRAAEVTAIMTASVHARTRVACKPQPHGVLPW